MTHSPWREEQGGQAEGAGCKWQGGGAKLSRPGAFYARSAPEYQKPGTGNGPRALGLAPRARGLRFRPLGYGAVLTLTVPATMPALALSTAAMTSVILVKAGFESDRPTPLSWRP